MNVDAGAHRGTSGVGSRLAAAFRALRTVPGIDGDEKLDLHALLELGDDEHLSPQDVVDEIHTAAEVEAGVSDE
jgi:hypothetical protein